MSDDLVQRLQKQSIARLDDAHSTRTTLTVHLLAKVYCDAREQDARLFREAAARIEVLEKWVTDLDAQHIKVMNHCDVLEAALREIINWQDLPAEGKGLTFALKKIQGMREIARRALELGVGVEPT